MKTIIGMILFAGLTAGVFNYAEAQRGRDNGGRGNRESNVSPQRGSSRSFSENRTFRQNNVSRNNSYNPGQRNERTFTPGRNDNNRVFSQRSAVTRNDARVNRPDTRRNNAVASSGYNRDRMSSGYNRDRISSGYDRDRISSGRYNNYRYNNYRYSNRYYGGGYYSFNNRRYSFMYGTRYTVIPRSYISIRFGGYPYYYNNGFFYGYYSGYYQPIFPPFGIHIGVLPYGYYSFYLGGYPYYYYNGIYYRQYDDYYEVVDAPMGASVYNLPQGARSVILNGEKLYELNGTYYKEDRDSNGRTIYTVVGKNGEVNNTDEGDSNNPGNYNNDNTNNDNNLNMPPSSSLQIGDIVTQLPEGSKVVTINGEKMYVSPDDTYLKEETDRGVVQYKVVGK